MSLAAAETARRRPVDFSGMFCAFMPPGRVPGKEISMYDPFAVLLMAVVLMLFSVLWLRMHPFLALLLSALLVSVVTPYHVRLGQAVRREAARVESVADQTGRISVDHRLESAQLLVYRRSQRGWLEPAGEIQVEHLESDGERPVYTVDGQVQVRPGDRLIAPSKLAAIGSALSDATPGERLASGLADTFQNVGLPIAMAAVIGTCLMQSGAAQRIVVAAQHVLGAQRTAPALTVSGFTLGIPVFFDTVFYLLLPLAKTIYRQNRQHYVLYVLAIVVGATMAHSLVPPTPGPLYVAAELNVNIGTMINAGLLLGTVTVTVGFLYARWANHRWQWSPGAGGEVLSPTPESCPLPVASLPPLGLSLLPILLPVLMLGGNSMLQSQMDSATNVPAWIHTAWQWAGDKHLVLLLSAGISLCLLAFAPAADHSARKIVGRSLGDAGVIILLTCAGGAFGAALRESGIAAAMEHRFPTTLSGMGILVLAFGTTALIRLAQGSATVAMITAAGIVGPLLQSASLPFHPVYVALAIGCGSKPFSWMNDSGFWVVSSMSGLDEVQTLKTFSVALTLMGLVGFVCTLLASVLWPLV